MITCMARDYSGEEERQEPWFHGTYTLMVVEGRKRINAEIKEYWEAWWMNATTKAKQGDIIGQ